MLQTDKFLTAFGPFGLLLLMSSMAHQQFFQTLIGVEHCWIPEVTGLLALIVMVDVSFDDSKPREAEIGMHEICILSNTQSRLLLQAFILNRGFLHLIHEAKP